MDVHIQSREGAEQLGSAVLLVALDDLMVTEYSLEPGTEPGDPHYHADHSDSFYVLDGELEFQIDGRMVHGPRGRRDARRRSARSLHAFPVAVGARARFLNLHTPRGFEVYLRELDQMRSRGERPGAEFLQSHDIFDV